MKKLLAMILAAMMIFAAVPTALMEGTEAVKEHLDIAYNNDEITVAVTTPITGNFFTSLWGNNTSDTDVRALLHGYDLIRFDNEIGAFCPDESVVSGYVVMENIPTGNRTYTFSLYHDLTWSDGTPITAWDYAFSVLLTMAPEIPVLQDRDRDRDREERHR